MAEKKLSILGAGITTDGYPTIHDLAKTAAPSAAFQQALTRTQTFDPTSLQPHDPLVQFSINALHQALTMAVIDSETNLALIVVTDWGMVDSTIAYLNSMLDADGRYASPRYFTRSVYSTAASALAIHFQIHGPCQTLVFDENENPVTGALAQAHRLLAARRADHVAILWAEQFTPIAPDLMDRAVKKLHRPKYNRYLEQGLGHGATALIVAPSPNPNALATLNLDTPPNTDNAPPAGKPFPMDAAVSFLTHLLSPKGAEFTL